MDLTSLYRSFLLAVAAHPWVSRTAQRKGMRLGASRFVAGETLEEALSVVRDLNRRSVLATLDYLGEGVRDEAVARQMGQAYLALLDGIAAGGLLSHVSLKLTQMGLTFSPALAGELVREIVERARQHGNFVRIDMEESRHVDATLALYLSLRKMGYDNVGTVVQSYLYRTEHDVQELDSAGLRPNLRIVKGAYREPPHLAYPRKADVDEAYRRIVARRLRAGLDTAVATHDERLIEWTIELVNGEGLAVANLEFQMLYGVRMRRQEELAREGYTVRCYVPYGEMWYPYFTRRLAERPGNAWFVLKNLFA